MAPNATLPAQLRRLITSRTAPKYPVNLAFFGLSDLSITQTTEFIAAARVGASPDLAARSSSWTVHFHEPGPTPCRMVNSLPRYSMRYQHPKDVGFPQI